MKGNVKQRFSLEVIEMCGAYLDALAEAANNDFCNCEVEMPRNEKKS
jgi:hypothetical protein